MIVSVLGGSEVLYFYKASLINAINETILRSEGSFGRSRSSKGESKTSSASVRINAMTNGRVRRRRQEESGRVRKSRQFYSGQMSNRGRLI
jgi:hypothetical protein